jgi:hypothetical protein
MSEGSRPAAMQQGGMHMHLRVQAAELAGTCPSVATPQFWQRMTDRKFNTGQTVPESGVYRVTHAGHRLPREVTLLAGQTFPRCSKCKAAVQFRVVRRAQFIDTSTGFKVIIYELPVLDEDDTPEALAS